MKTKDFLWQIVLERKEMLERVCAKDLKEPGRGASKLLAECAMNNAFQEWYKFVTR